jgi:hypothetical protein
VEKIFNDEFSNMACLFDDASAVGLVGFLFLVMGFLFWDFF